MKKSLPSKLPLIQAPMVGSFSPLAVAVCQAGGLGSLACAALAPTLRAQIADIRAHTGAPFNVNFFSHVAPAPDEAAQARWRETLAPYYAEAGLDLSAAGSGPGRAPFDEAMCEVVEDTRPAVVSFHFGLPPEDLLERAAQRRHDPVLGHHGRGSALAGRARRGRHHRPGSRGRRPSRHVPDR